MLGYAIASPTNLKGAITMTQLTIDLPDTTYQALKIEAQHRQESIDKLIIRYLSAVNLTPINDAQDNWSADFFAKTAGCFAENFDDALLQQSTQNHP
jgi:hypothetical protein